MERPEDIVRRRQQREADNDATRARIAEQMAESERQALLLEMHRLIAEFLQRAAVNEYPGAFLMNFWPRFGPPTQVACWALPDPFYHPAPDDRGPTTRTRYFLDTIGQLIELNASNVEVGYITNQWPGSQNRRKPYRRNRPRYVSWEQVRAEQLRAWLAHLQDEMKRLAL